MTNGIIRNTFHNITSYDTTLSKNQFYIFNELLFEKLFSRFLQILIHTSQFHFYLFLWIHI